jgi:hypothetical protein
MFYAPVATDLDIHEPVLAILRRAAAAFAPLTPAPAIARAPSTPRARRRVNRRAMVTRNRRRILTHFATLG